MMNDWKFEHRVLVTAPFSLVNTLMPTETMGQIYVNQETGEKRFIADMFLVELEMQKMHGTGEDYFMSHTIRIDERVKVFEVWWSKISNQLHVEEVH